MTTLALLFARERNGSCDNTALKLTFISIWDKVDSDDYRLTCFPFDRPDSDSLCLCNLYGKEQLAVKLSDDFSAKNHCASWCCWFLQCCRQKLTLCLPRKLLYSSYDDETLKQWAKEILAALSAKEHVMATETNTATHPLRIFRHRKNNNSVKGVFCSTLDLNTAGKKPCLSVSVKIFVRCTWFSFVRLNGTLVTSISNYYFTICQNSQ